MTVHIPSVLLAVGWVAVTLALARPARRPDRVRALVPPAPSHRGLRTAGRHRPAVSAPVGRAARRLVGRPPDDAADRRAGRAVLAVLIAAVAGLPVPVVLAGAVVWACRPILVERAARRRQDHELVDALPDAVDLLRLAVQAGCNGHLAVTLVGERLDGALGQKLRAVCDEVALGVRLADALSALRATEPLRPMAEVLIDAERYGVALTSSLDRLADEARSRRRRRAEERARRLPVTMLFPLVCCILPSFGLLTVVPLIAGTLRTLQV
ncbi:MAG: type II secretion system F family protein [Acidimicrobiales bacterium]